MRDLCNENVCPHQVTNFPIQVILLQSSTMPFRLIRHVTCNRHGSCTEGPGQRFPFELRCVTCLCHPFAVSGVLVIISSTIILCSFSMRIFFLFFSFTRRFHVGSICVCTFNNFKRQGERKLVYRTIGPYEVRFYNCHMSMAFFPIKKTNTKNVPIIRLVNRQNAPGVRPRQ